MSKIKIFVHKTDIENHLAKAISNYLSEHAHTSVLFLVSGGSARAVLEYIDESVLGKNITVSVVDERFSREEETSNFLLLSHTQFYTRALAHGVTFISSFPEEGESIEAASARWEQALRAWEEAHADNSAIMVLMGMGSDGHVAGIVPFPEDLDTFRTLFEDKTRWIVGYDAGNKNQYPLRTTSTISFLETKVDHAFMYVKGEEKEHILKTVLGSREIPRYPAAVIHTMKHVELYTTIECT